MWIGREHLSNKAWSIILKMNDCGGINKPLHLWHLAYTRVCILNLHAAIKVCVRKELNTIDIEWTCKKRWASCKNCAWARKKFTSSTPSRNQGTKMKVILWIKGSSMTLPTFFLSSRWCDHEYKPLKGVSRSNDTFQTACLFQVEHLGLGVISL